MNPQLLQSMLPNNNSSEEANSNPIESSEVSNEKETITSGEARTEDFVDSSAVSDKPILRARFIKINKNNDDHIRHSLKVKTEKVHEQHQKRLAELMEYLNTHMMSTIYFHNEMKRILEQRKVKDDLRKMVTVLEHEPLMKQKVLACYKRYREKIEKTRDIWKNPTNDLVINYVYEY